MTGSKYHKRGRYLDTLVEGEYAASWLINVNITWVLPQWLISPGFAPMMFSKNPTGVNLITNNINVKHPIFPILVDVNVEPTSFLSSALELPPSTKFYTWVDFGSAMCTQCEIPTRIPVPSFSLKSGSPVGADRELQSENSTDPKKGDPTMFLSVLV